MGPIRHIAGAVRPVAHETPRREVVLSGYTQQIPRPELSGCEPLAQMDVSRMIRLAQAALLKAFVHTWNLIV